MLNTNRRKIIYASLALFLFILLNAAGALAGTATLSWTAPTTNSDGSPLSDLSGYKVYYGTTSGSYTQTTDVGNVTTYEVTGLTEGSTYYFVTTAYDTSGNESTYSGEVSKSITDNPPVITGVYSDSLTTSSAVINWTTDEAADTQVEYGTTASYGYISTLDSTMTTSHSTMVAGLTASTLYHYRVLSRDSGGNLTTSGDNTFTTVTPDTTPPVISSVSVTNITGTSVTVTWSTDEASTSQVEYGLSVSYGTLTTLDTNLVTSHSVDISGLSGYTVYDFRVRSSDAADNEGVSANNTFTTSNTAPSTPTLSVSSSSGLAPLYVDFTATATDSDGYITKYEWDIDGNGSYEVDSGMVASTSYTYSSVGTYNTRLRVTDNGGATSVSSVVTVTVNSASNLSPVVSSLTATPSSGAASLVVTLSAVASDSDGSIAQYEWDFDGNGTYDATTATTPVSHTFTSAGTYIARVRVTDNQGGTATGQTTITVTDVGGKVGLGGGAKGRGGAGGAGGGCFIASAAFGSYLEPHVEVLRNFRDDYLLTNGPGTAFVKFYYKTSPPIADYISRHDGVKFVIRLILTPVVYGVKYPGVSALGLVMMIVPALYLVRGVRNVKKPVGYNEIGDKDITADNKLCSSRSAVDTLRLRRRRGRWFQ